MSAAVEIPQSSSASKSASILRVGLIQMRCEKGAIAENLERIAHCLAEAAARQIDILGLPEMSLTGYADPNKYPHALLSIDGPEVEQFLQVTKSFSGTVLVGLIEANPAGKPFITHLAAREGKLIGWYRKVTIIDEEVDWFSAGSEVPGFQHDDVPFGVAICADLTNREVFAKSSGQGARVIFELAAPGLYGEQATRNWKAGYDWWEAECRQYLSSYARDFGVWICVATQAGRTVDEDFPGGAFVFAPNGERLFATTDGTEGMVFLEIDLEAERINALPSGYLSF